MGKIRDQPYTGGDEDGFKLMLSNPLRECIPERRGVLDWWCLLRDVRDGLRTCHRLGGVLGDGLKRLAGELMDRFGRCVLLRNGEVLPHLDQVGIGEAGIGAGNLLDGLGNLGGAGFMDAVGLQHVFGNPPQGVLRGIRDGPGLSTSEEACAFREELLGERDARQGEEYAKNCKTNPLPIEPLSLRADGGRHGADGLLSWRTRAVGFGKPAPDDLGRFIREPARLGEHELEHLGEVGRQTKHRHT